MCVYSQLAEVKAVFSQHSTHRGGLDKPAFTSALLRLSGASPTTARGGRVSLIGKLLFDSFDAGACGGVRLPVAALYPIYKAL